MLLSLDLGASKQINEDSEVRGRRGHANRGDQLLCFYLGWQVDRSCPLDTRVSRIVASLREDLLWANGRQPEPAILEYSLRASR